MSNAEKVTTKKTFEDWQALPEKPKTELVEGIFVFMASPSPWHCELQGKLFRITDTAAEEEQKEGKNKGWRILPEAGVYYDLYNIFQHDLAGWRVETMPKLPPKSPIHIRPDWVCEILSTNRSRDTVLKRRVLHRFGVPYYWLVDTAHAEISVYKLGSEDYILLDVIPLDQELACLPPFLGEIKLNLPVDFGE